MDRNAITQRLLLVYSGVLTLVLSVVLLSASSSPKKKVSFDEIDVQRLNLREPDGTLRLVIAGRANFPGLIVKGKEYPHDRQTAGILFFDDEGTENGGLIFGGRKGKDGTVHGWGHLSFDRYMGDQVAVLNAEEDDTGRHSEIQLVDEPDIPMNQITDALQLPPDQRKAKLHELFSGDNQPHERVFLGRRIDRSAALQLKDGEGRSRIVLMVAPDGTPSLQFLDASGNVTGQLPKERP